MPTPLGRGANGATSTALPDPFPLFAKSRYAAQFRRAQFHMLAGPPGCGKSAFALIAALRMNVPTLYVSADSDPATMQVRTVSALTKENKDAVKRVLDMGLFGEEYGELLASSPLRFMFTPSDPTLKDLVNAMNAYEEINGIYPELLIVDNLFNLTGDSGEEWGALRKACKALQFICRKTKAAVLVLHHTSEQDPKHIDSAPPRGAIQGKLSQYPEVIYTMGSSLGVVWLATVKNRDGISDPHALEPYRFWMNHPQMQIDDNITQKDYDGIKAFQPV